jgi:hypothetical protein
MKQLESSIVGKVDSLYNFEQVLKPIGFSIGGNWEYHSGFFDYKIKGKEKYEYLRIPFEATSGELDTAGTIVEIGKPFVLAHRYQDGVDDYASTNVASGSFNQFSEPEEYDADISDGIVGKAEVVLRRVEELME